MPAIASRINRIEKALVDRGEGGIVILKLAREGRPVGARFVAGLDGRTILYVRYPADAVVDGKLVRPIADLIPGDHPDRARMVGHVLRAAHTILVTYK